MSSLFDNIDIKAVIKNIKNNLIENKEEIILYFKNSKSIEKIINSILLINIDEKKYEFCKYKKYQLNCYYSTFIHYAGYLDGLINDIKLKKNGRLERNFIIISESIFKGDNILKMPKIKEIVQEKNIPCILHFTRLCNLDSILKHGLIGNETLTSNSISYKNNDTLRLDGYANAICCSIAFPNYKMFYKLRKENPGIEWVILGIKRKILWQKNVAFCHMNAASSEITSRHISEFKTEEALLKLFENVSSKKTREALCLPTYYPTNPQAEVLVFDTIEPENIFGFVFNNNIELVEYYRKLYPSLDIQCNTKLFAGRNDYSEWQQNGN